ncbi:MAG: hypothetical protein KDK51_04960, partial [Deltaproteobacteria bacterium]|nr:hypothetical protein [Deltaproteobacteria bacterium]
PFGLGIILGEPTGLSGNIMLDQRSSVDMALAYDLTGDQNLHMHADYLIRNPKSIAVESLRLGWYGGLGAQFRTHEDNGGNDDFRIGPRAVIGLNHEFTQAPIEVFTEFALIMHVIPATDLDVNFGIGGRFYF